MAGTYFCLAHMAALTLERANMAVFFQVLDLRERASMAVFLQVRRFAIERIFAEPSG